MQKGLFLRIGEGPYRFLLATEDVREVVKRDDRQPEADGTPSIALTSFIRGDTSWPVLRLGSVLGFEAGEWKEAVLLNDGGTAVGFAIETTRLLEESYALDVRPFFSVGCYFGPHPLYKGVCKDGGELTLVFDAAGVGQMLRAALCV